MFIVNGRNRQYLNLNLIIQKEKTRSITLPTQLVSVGRPKGSKTTTIGVKRKQKIEVTVVAKKRFIQKPDNDQALTILEWLTKKTREEIVTKKVCVSDVTEDPVLLSRLRNPEVNLKYVMKFVDSECLEYLFKLKNTASKSWPCGTCNKTIFGKQVSCENCLDWHHYKCVGALNVKSTPFFCVHC